MPPVLRVVMTQLGVNGRRMPVFFDKLGQASLARGTALQPAHPLGIRRAQNPPPNKKARMAPAIRAFLSYSPAFMDSTMSIFFIFRPITRLTRKEKNMVMAAASR